MLSEPRLQPFLVEVRFRDLKKKEHVERYTLDVGQFDGLARIGGDPQEELTKAVKEIADELQKWTRRALPVETATRAELRREEQEYIDQVRAEAWLTTCSQTPRGYPRIQNACTKHPDRRPNFVGKSTKKLAASSAHPTVTNKCLRRSPARAMDHPPLIAVLCKPGARQDAKSRCRLLRTAYVWRPGAIIRRAEFEEDLHETACRLSHGLQR